MAGTHTYRRLELGEYSIPEEALQLQSDIDRMDLIIHLLEEIDSDSLHDDKSEGFKIKRRLVRVVATWRWFAWDKLRKKFLGGKAFKKRQRPQTLADIAAILFEREGDSPVKDNTNDGHANQNQS